MPEFYQVYSQYAWILPGLKPVCLNSTMSTASMPEFCQGYSQYAWMLLFQQNLYLDDIIAIFKCIWWCYKANSFTRHLKNNLFCEMGLFTLHNCCVSSPLHFLKIKLDSLSRPTIPEFSCYHCIWQNYKL